RRHDRHRGLRGRGAAPPQLLRPQHPHLPRPRRRRGLRPPGRGEAQRPRGARPRAARTPVDPRARRDGDEHRPLPARGGPLPADARHRRGPARDRDAALDALLGEIAAAAAAGASVLALHLRPGTREWFHGWLAREHPGLLERYAALYGRGAYVEKAYREDLTARVAPLLRRHGLA